MRVLRPFAAIVFVAAAWPQPLSGVIYDIAIDAQGDILVAVPDFYQVLKVAPDGTISVFAGTGRRRDYRDPGGDGGPAVAAELRRAVQCYRGPANQRGLHSRLYSGPQGGFQRNHHHRRRLRGIRATA